MTRTGRGELSSCPGGRCDAAGNETADTGDDIVAGQLTGEEWADTDGEWVDTDGEKDDTGGREDASMAGTRD